MNPQDFYTLVYKTMDGLAAVCDAYMNPLQFFTERAAIRELLDDPIHFAGCTVMLMSDLNEYRNGWLVA